MKENCSKIAPNMDSVLKITDATVDWHASALILRENAIADGIPAYTYWELLPPSPPVCWSVINATNRLITPQPETEWKPV